MGAGFHASFGQFCYFGMTLVCHGGIYGTAAEDGARHPLLGLQLTRVMYHKSRRRKLTDHTALSHERGWAATR